MTEERHLGGVHEVPSSENIAITSKAALSSGYVEPPTSPECDESRACAADLRAQYETTAEAPFSGASRGAMAAMHKSKKQLAEDEEYTSDHDLTQLGDKSPFNNIRHLLRYPAHLAVFLRYLLDNQSDFSSLLFLIITDLYKRGSRKEMKKWVYEITSTFLLQSAVRGTGPKRGIPRATPLRWLKQHVHYTQGCFPVCFSSFSASWHQCFEVAHVLFCPNTNLPDF